MESEHKYIQYRRPYLNYISIWQLQKSSDGYAHTSFISYRGFVADLQVQKLVTVAKLKIPITLAGVHFYSDMTLSPLSDCNTICTLSYARFTPNSRQSVAKHRGSVRDRSQVYHGGRLMVVFLEPEFMLTDLRMVCDSRKLASLSWCSRKSIVLLTNYTLFLSWYVSCSPASMQMLPCDRTMKVLRLFTNQRNKECFN